MNELIINKMENAFGIKKLSINVCNQKQLKNVAIYAPNGTFKTSFSKTFNDLSKNERVFDRLTDEDLKCDCYIGLHKINEAVLKDNMIVFSKEIMDGIDFNKELQSDLLRITTIDYKNNELNSLKNKLDEIYNELIQYINSLKIKEEDFINIVGCVEKTKIDRIRSLLNTIKNAQIIENDEIVEAKLLFSKTYTIIDNAEFKKNINEFKSIIISEEGSDFFTNGFTINNALQFVKTINNTSFLSKKDKRIIKISDLEFDDPIKLEEFINGKIEKVINTQDGKKLYDFIDKEMGKSKNTSEFKSKLKSDIRYLELFSYTRKEILLSKIKRLYLLSIDERINEINELKTQIEDISNEANEQITLFEKAIEIFNERFNPAFITKIENKKSIYLDHSFPQIVFYHKRVQTKRNNLQEISSILSSGEKTALNVIKFIVKYESIKQNNPIIILDDVVETFDYGNRHAFLRYIQELKSLNCNIIVLSNNYDFFRTVCSRAELTPLAATINKDYSINITGNKHLLLKFDKIKDISSADKLIFSIPFARETDDLRGGRHKEFYDKLFHYNKSSSRLHVNKVISVLNEFSNKITYSDKNNPKFIDILYQECDKVISKKNDPFEIKPKIILALGIRIKCEQLIIDKDFTKINSINKNQTKALYDIYKDLFVESFLEVMDEVLVATPEFLHLNAFMYEPLIDINPEKLIRIYNKLKDFENISIWK